MPAGVGSDHCERCVLFGPIWGKFYNLTGATIGAIAYTYFGYAGRNAVAGWRGHDPENTPGLKTTHTCYFFTTTCQTHAHNNYIDGLEGIDDYSHLIVLCWLDKAGKVKPNRLSKNADILHLPIARGIIWLRLYSTMI